jgi:hypothetical protein
MGNQAPVRRQSPLPGIWEPTNQAKKRQSLFFVSRQTSGDHARQGALPPYRGLLTKIVLLGKVSKPCYENRF